MSFPTALRGALTGTAAVTALVGSRIYFVRLPQEPVLPAITMELLDGDPDNTISGAQALHWARVRIHSWASTYGAAYELALVVHTALNAQTFTTLRSINGRGMHDLYEPAVFAYYISQDFSIGYTD